MATVDQPMRLTYHDYPGLYQAADAASSQQQTAFLRIVRIRLILVVLAASFSSITFRTGTGAIDVFAIGAALAFVGVLVVELAVTGSRPDKGWYKGRALAESVKTLTWRYAVGAAPFPVSRNDADQEFVARLRAMRDDLPDVPLLPTTAPVITQRMRTLRAEPLANRRRAYLVGRVVDQQNWYAAKAEFHRRRARVYRAVMLILEVVGVAGALAKAVGLVDFDLAGIVAAMVSAATAWTTARQHSVTATAYVVATHDLGIIRDLLDRPLDEEDWASEVVDAEAAISREHTMWRANHK